MSYQMEICFRLKRKGSILEKFYSTPFPRRTQKYIILFVKYFKKIMKDIDGYSFKGIHNMVLDSINRSDIDIRKELLSNIIVCGGNTLLTGVVEKLQQKVSETAPQVHF